jgi:hypothetical protein
LTRRALLIVLAGLLLAGCAQHAAKPAARHGSSHSTGHTASASPVGQKPLAVPVGAASSRHIVWVKVPSDWHVSTTQPASSASTCVTTGTKEYDGNPSDCALVVTQLPASQSPDYPQTGAQGHCAKWKTLAASNKPIEGRLSEYRYFSDGCSGVKSEQWTTVTAPSISFWHAVTATDTHAEFVSMVGAAVLPAVADKRRVNDAGLVSSLNATPHGGYVVIDRIVPALDGSLINHAAATFRYPLTGVQTGSPTCGTPGCRSYVTLVLRGSAYDLHWMATQPWTG